MKEDRQIYAIKVVDYLVQENGNGNTESQDSTLTPDTSGGDVVLPDFPINNPNLMDQGCSATTNTEYQSCVICMEDLPICELKQHNACDCVICVPCLERTIGKKTSRFETVSLMKVKSSYGVSVSNPVVRKSFTFRSLRDHLYIT